MEQLTIPILLGCRSRKGDKAFLVANYACEEKYSLLAPETSKLYCSRREWIGERPVCVRVASDGDGDDAEGESHARIT